VWIYIIILINGTGHGDPTFRFICTEMIDCPRALVKETMQPIVTCWLINRKLVRLSFPGKRPIGKPIWRKKDRDPVMCGLLPKLCHLFHSRFMEKPIPLYSIA